MYASKSRFAEHELRPRHGGDPGSKYTTNNTIAANHDQNHKKIE